MHTSLFLLAPFDCFKPKTFDPMFACIFGPHRLHQPTRPHLYDVHDFQLHFVATLRNLVPIYSTVVGTVGIFRTEVHPLVWEKMLFVLSALEV